MIYRISTRTVFFALALSGLVLTATAARSEIIEQILVKVNGEILTKTDLETRQVQALRRASALASRGRVARRRSPRAGGQRGPAKRK